MDKSKRKLILFIALGLFFLFPVVYLVIKTNGLPEIQKETALAAPQQNQDITALESLATTAPTFDNLINLSMAYINNNMPGKSISYLKKAIELNPQSAIAYNNLGVAYTMLQQYQNGIDACTKALQIDSDFQLAKNNLAWASDEKNKTIAAIAEQEKTPTEKRTNDFYTNYGLNYFKIGEYDKSISIWEKITEKEPKNCIALNNIGTAYMMKNQIDEAITVFKKCLEFEPNNQLAKNNLAWALGEKK